MKMKRRLSDFFVFVLFFFFFTFSDRRVYDLH